MAKTKGVDTATEIELSTLNNIIYQFCIVDKQTSLKQAKSELLDMWKHVKESNPYLKTEGISLDREPRTKNLKSMGRMKKVTLTGIYLAIGTAEPANSELLLDRRALRYSFRGSILSRLGELT